MCGLVPIPGQGTKIPQAVCHSHKKKANFCILLTPADPEIPFSLVGRNWNFLWSIFLIQRGAEQREKTDTGEAEMRSRRDLWGKNRQFILCAVEGC